VWSDRQIRTIGNALNFAIAPDGKRFAVFPLPEATAQDKGAAQAYSRDSVRTAGCPSGRDFPLSGRRIGSALEMAFLVERPPGARWCISVTEN